MTFCYIMPADTALMKPTTTEAIVHNLAMFLKANGHHVDDTMDVGKVRAEHQRKIWGVSLGRGNLVVDGFAGHVSSMIKVCFGTDVHINAELSTHSNVLRLPTVKHDAEVTRFCNTVGLRRER